MWHSTLYRPLIAKPKHLSKILLLLARLIVLFLGKFLFADGYSVQAEIVYYCMLLLAGFVFIFFGKERLKKNVYALVFSIVGSAFVLVYFLIK